MSSTTAPTAPTAATASRRSPGWARPLWRTTVAEGRLYLRDPAGVFFTLAFPVIILAVSGGGGNRPLAEYGGAGRNDLQVAGYLGMVIATMSVMGIPEQLSQYREWGVLRRLRATPMHAGTIIGAEVALATVVTVAGGALLVVTGLLGFGLDVPAAPGAVMSAFLMGTASMLALAFLLASLPFPARTTRALAMMVFFPMIFVSGATFPSEELPVGARVIGDALPLSYAVDALKDGWLDGTWNAGALAVLAVTATVAAALAVRLFRWE